ncbi:PPOX class F420-dependent oxidoreductase [Georgenia deserti]|uniref:PPOX class F420-dependent oxidoreductase n=1 Tax=Georgenia deserti TaxID=2093781 RepID=A0ABW4L5F7_9MICO
MSTSTSTSMSTSMSTFTARELGYLRRGVAEAQLARLATVGRDGRPHVTPLGFTYDPESDAILIGGHAGTHMAGSKKFRDARANPEVALVVDDVATTDPWRPRGLEIRGRAETFTEGGEEVGARLEPDFPWDPAWIRIRPRRILSWGIDTDSFELAARDVEPA